MSGRTLFERPVRYTTELFFPEKMTLDEFISSMEAALRGYKGNMEHLDRQPDYTFAREPHHVEEWTESFLAWSEIEQERPND